MKKAIYLWNPLIILVGIFIFIQCLPIFADNIIIVGSDKKYPKAYLENQKPKGILIEIMEYIDKYTDYSFTFELYPWARAYKMAIEGKAGIIQLSKNSERLKIFDYSDIMYYDEILLVTLKDHTFPYKTMKDLKGKHLGVTRGASYGDEFEEGKKNIFIVDEDTDSIQRLKKLLYGRIDVALIGPGKASLNQAICRDPELLQNKDKFTILETPFRRNPNHLGFAKTMKMKNFLIKFNRILKQGFEDGTIQRIIDKYSE